MSTHGEGTVTPPDPNAPFPTHDFNVGDTVAQPGHDVTYTVLEDRGRTLLCKRDTDGTEYEMNPTKLEAV